jgi:hypothetical protein
MYLNCPEQMRWLKVIERTFLPLTMNLYILNHLKLLDINLLFHPDHLFLIELFQDQQFNCNLN